MPKAIFYLLEGDYSGFVGIIERTEALFIGVI